MCLIKQKLKTKHYQYLYLKYKIEQMQEKMYWYSDHCGYDTDKDDAINEYYYFKESKRLDCLNSWLDKINKKYNYA